MPKKDVPDNTAEIQFGVVTRVAIDAVFRDPANARKHESRNLNHIRASLRRFGQQRPLVVRADGMIIAGNGTHEGAEAEGWKEIEIIYSPLEGFEAAAYAIADNQIATTSAWNFEALASTIASIKEFEDEEFDFESLGFLDHEIGPLLEAEWKPPAIDDDDDQNTAAKNDSKSKGDAASGDPSGDHDPNLDAGDKTSSGRPIQFTANQRELVDQAIERFKIINDDHAITDGRIIELICADYLAGAPLLTSAEERDVERLIDGSDE